ncbi:MAG: hypothetical protein ACPL4I_12355 [Bacteroidota bacterium]
MSEIPQIPIPLINYVKLIKRRETPYYQIVQLLLKDMEMHCASIEKSEVVYTINPRVLQEEIEKRIRSEKITTVNICRTILALLHGSKLSEGEDFYITTTSGGRKNYHIKVNPKTLSRLSSFL